MVINLILNRIKKKNINIFLLILIAPFFISCDLNEKSSVEKLCEKNPDYKKCLTNKEYFLKSLLVNWEPTWSGQIGLKNVEKRNTYSNKWIGANINYENAIKINSLNEIKISFSSNPSLNDKEKLIAGEKLKNNIYLFEGLVTFCNERTINDLKFYCPNNQVLLLDMNHENSSTQSLSFRRFGLTSKELDILKLCQIRYYSFNKDTFICKGQFLISIEIYGVSYTDLKHLNYYLESFKLFKDNLNEKKNLLRNNRVNFLSKEFDLHLDEMIKK